VTSLAINELLELALQSSAYVSFPLSLSRSCSSFCLYSILSEWLPSLPPPLIELETDHTLTHSSRLPSCRRDERLRTHHTQSIWSPGLFSVLLSHKAPLNPNPNPNPTYQVANACGMMVVYCLWALILYSPLTPAPNPLLLMTLFTLFYVPPPLAQRSFLAIGLPLYIQSSSVSRPHFSNIATSLAPHQHRSGRKLQLKVRQQSWTATRRHLKEATDPTMNSRNVGKRLAGKGALRARRICP
jgi:hypothetical protein